MSTQSMRAGVRLRFDRAPDYFALHEAHSDDHETWCLWKGTDILGIASLVQRPGWVNGSVEPVVYLADLRFARNRAAAGSWRSVMRDILVEVHARTGARLAFCSIIRQNNAARNALLHSTRANSIRFEHLRGYSNVSIVARKPWASRSDRRVAVTRACTQDGARLRAFADALSGTTQFGPVFDERCWKRRLAQWPNFGIDRFHMALDESDNVAGCLALWDSSSINRAVIERLPRSANFVRLMCNALTPLTRRPRVGLGAGSWLPDIALTHLFVAERSAHVFAALLHAAHREVFAGRRHATMSVCLYDGDPFWRALADYWYVAVPMDLYWADIGVIAGCANAQAPGSGTDVFPGFESYLV